MFADSAYCTTCEECACIIDPDEKEECKHKDRTIIVYHISCREFQGMESYIVDQSKWCGNIQLTKYYESKFFDGMLSPYIDATDEHPEEIYQNDEVNPIAGDVCSLVPGTYKHYGSHKAMEPFHDMYFFADIYKVVEFIRCTEYEYREYAEEIIRTRQDT